MKFETPIKGFIEYKEKDCPFIYENGILQIFPTTIQLWKENKFEIFYEFKKWTNSYMSNDEWINNTYLYGRTQDEYDIAFYVSEESANDNGFISFQVIFCYKYKSDELDCSNIYKISLEGRELDYFYPSSKVFHYDIDSNNSLKSVSVVPIKRELISEYEYKNTKIQIYSNIIITIKENSNNPLLSETKFEIIFSEPKNIEFTLDVYHHFKLFLQYICRRTNVQISNINVYSKVDDKYSNDGIIEYIEDNCNEDDLNQKKKIIRYEYLKNKISKIFEDISKNKIYFEHLCPSISKTDSYNPSRIILNFVAFEREYRNIYPEELERSEEYCNTKDEVIQYLEDKAKENTGKKKKYIKSFKKAIDKTENSYGLRVKKALIDCEEILNPFLNYSYKNYNEEILDEISERMNNLRNDCTHGNIDLDIKPININDFKILECLTYVMRLKYIGVEKINIQKAINDLMNFHLSIKSK